MTRLYAGKTLMYQINREKEILPESVSKTVRQCVRGHVRKAKGAKSFRGK
jgi:hypothetical protein